MIAYTTFSPTLHYLTNAVPLTNSQKDFKIELDRANGVSTNKSAHIHNSLKNSQIKNLRQLEFLQHTRVQDAEDANGVVLAAEVDLDSRGVAREEGRV